MTLLHIIRVDYPNFLNTSLETRLHFTTRILRDIKADYEVPRETSMIYNRAHNETQAQSHAVSHSEIYFTFARPSWDSNFFSKFFIRRCNLTYARCNDINQVY